jgi:hypothetical protein
VIYRFDEIRREVVVLDFDEARSGAGFLIFFLELEACLLWHCLALVAGWLVGCITALLLACLFVR